MATHVCLLLTVVVSGLIVYDLNEHGSFAGSRTETFLKDPQKNTKLVLAQLRSYSQQAYRWSQKNIPRAISQIREGFIPFLHKVQEVFVALIVQLWTHIKLIWQYFVDKKPIFAQWMYGTAPGLWESVTLWLSRMWVLVYDYSLQLAALIIHLVSTAAQWLRENFFVYVHSSRVYVTP